MRNNKAQSLISVMLFIVVISIIVTLIIASSISDTKRLIAEKSYQKTYAIAEKYLSTIVFKDLSEDVFGLSDTDFASLINTENIACAFDASVENTKTFMCTSGDHKLTCSKQLKNYMLAAKLQTDKPLRINLENASVRVPYNMVGSPDTHTFINIRFADVTGVNFQVKYTINNVLKSINFGIANSGDYNNFDNVDVSGYAPSSQGLTIPTRKVDGTTGSLNVSNQVFNTTSYSSQVQKDLVDNSLNIENSYSFGVDLTMLQRNLEETIGATTYQATLNSMDINFLDVASGTATFSISLDRFNPNTDLQFNRYSCKGYDLEADASNIISGSFSSVDLESYTPNTKATLPIFNYGLFLTNQDPAGSAIISK